MISVTFAALTVFALVLGLLVKLWLSLRQQRFVMARRDEVPELFAGQVSLAAHQKAADYLCARTWSGHVELLLGSTLFLVLTWGGLLAGLHDYWQTQIPGLWAGVALIVSVAFLSMLLDTPLDIYRTFSLEARFGFNRTTPRLFVLDRLKSMILFALIGVPLIAFLLWLTAVAGDWWWFYAWLFLVGFNLVTMVVYPLWIAPWFNSFTRLPAGEARERVEQLLKRCNFAASDIFIMDGSRRSSHGNAYFTGLGKARRIVFFDTLLNCLTPLQIEAVLAHELGHFHHHHIMKRMILIFVTSFAFFALLGQLIDAPWFFEGLGAGAGNVGNAALAMLLFSLVVPLFAFFFTPLFSHFSRRDEFQADAYAMRVSSAPALAEALVKLYQDNATTLTPDPIHSRFYDSHPPALERVSHLLAAAETGAPLRAA